MILAESGTRQIIEGYNTLQTMDLIHYFILI